MTQLHTGMSEEIEDARFHRIQFSLLNIIDVLKWQLLADDEAPNYSSHLSSKMYRGKMDRLYMR